MSSLLIITISLSYLAILFIIAYLVERRNQEEKQTGSSWIYALSLAVYCTGWTYYGSVGRAAVSGADFLTIYLGPSVMCAMFIPVLQKIIHICKTQRISSIADFISTRYGKNFSLGIIVTLCCVLGIIPYIALQLKAISNSFQMITGNSVSGGDHAFPDNSFVIAVVMAAFIVLFGTRSVDASERHRGIVAAIAFESVVKLIVFIAAGIFVTWGLYNGFGNLFDVAREQHFMQFLGLAPAGGYSNWLAMLLVAMLAVILLPRQFQVAVIENTDVRHLRRAAWLFPLYLLAINIFVVPIAIAGKHLLPAGVDADTYVLSVPLFAHAHTLAVFVYIGGLSAASGMIIVETIALATMVSNHLVFPTFLRSLHKRSAEMELSSRILLVRRVSIFAILLLAYLYDRYIAAYFSLVSIGVVSMAAVAQFAPAVFGGLYWKYASRKGAVAGIISGFVVWFYTLIFPSFAGAGFIGKSVLDAGPWGISWLRPQALLGLTDFGMLAHSLFWSLLINLLCYIVVSVLSTLSSEELVQAEIFTDLNDDEFQRGAVWKGTAYIADIRRLVSGFIGRERAYNLIASYAHRNQISTQEPEADPRIVVFAEKILSGVIGSASARFMISNATREEQISVEEVLNIVKESQQALELNKELRKKSIELTRATHLLQEANDQLRQADAIKDEFLYTVTHELRTPLTSIRAMSEIVYDNPDMEEPLRQEYLGNIVTEIERLSYLITQVLNLEKYESGRQKLHLHAVDISRLMQEVITALTPLAQPKGITISFHNPASMLIVQCDRDLIRQVGYNLIANALKYVPATGGQVDVSIRQENGEIFVWIEDNGRGVPVQLHTRIFEKFFQAQDQNLRKPEGSGLGLAICKRIMEMHGGRIWVENRMPEGARFIFALPFDI